MKYLILALLPFLILSCCREEEPLPICTSVVSDSCTCPEETHYTFTGWEETTGPDCVEKGDNRYRSSFTGNNCLSNSAGTFDVHSTEGLATFVDLGEDSPNGAVLIMYYGPYSYASTAGGCQFVDFDITVKDDGSQDVAFRYVDCGFQRNCFDWAERSDCTLLSEGGVVGYFSGSSNPDRTRYEFDIEWIDCNDLVLDTGTLVLSK